MVTAEVLLWLCLQAVCEIDTSWQTSHRLSRHGRLPEVLLEIPQLVDPVVGYLDTELKQMRSDLDE